MGLINISWAKAKAYLAVIFLQFGLAGMAIIAKFALNKGLNHYIFVVYRHVIATIVIAPFAIAFERKVRPKMTPSIMIKILLLGLLEPVIDQNLYYMGLKYTTATFVAALCNILPALTFVLAWIFRLEKVNLNKVHSLAKVGGTIVTVGGATLMTLVKGPVLKLPWTKATSNHDSTLSSSFHDQIKGAIMIFAGCVCWAGFVILQTVTLKSYPAEMSLTTLICLAGTIEGGIAALVMERSRDPSVWALHFDAKLLAYVYSGIVCSGVTYCLQGMVIKERGPVFVTAFSPLSMIIVALMGSFILAEQLTVGRLIGAVVIVTGLYLVIWGKSHDQNQDHDQNPPNTNQQILPIGSSQEANTNTTNRHAPNQDPSTLNVEITGNYSV